MPNICVGLDFNNKKAAKYLISIIIEKILLQSHFLDNIFVKMRLHCTTNIFAAFFFGKNAEHRRGVIENLYLLYLLQSFDAALRTSPCLLRNRRGNRPGVGRTCAEVDQPEGGARSGGHHDGDDGGDHDYDGDHDDVGGGDDGGNYGGDDEKYEREMSPKIKALFVPLLISLNAETPCHSVWLRKSLYQIYVMKMTK